jgi:hypothetical protein
MLIVTSGVSLKYCSDFFRELRLLNGQSIMEKFVYTPGSINSREKPYALGYQSIPEKGCL